MAKQSSQQVEKGEVSVEEKLRTLYELQQIDSQIDKIRTIRGELPLEVSDLEDEVEGLQTRVNKLTEEVNALEDSAVERKNGIKEAQAQIKKYEGQQSKVRNNREYDSITKEIEYQNLEIQLCEKKIKEYKVQITQKNEMIDSYQKNLNERKNDLEHKKNELDAIIAETQKEEQELIKKSQQDEKIIDERLLSAYKKIRTNARNGLAVVTVQRDSCGGCFNSIPPQRQLDIKTHKKVIICEYCGRILVDANILSPELEKA